MPGMSVHEYNIMHCRAYGHQWDSMAIGIAADIYEEDLQCEHCSTIRTDTVSRKGPNKGKTIKRKYTYPKDEFWVNKPTREEARLSLLKSRKER